MGAGGDAVAAQRADRLAPLLEFVDELGGTALRRWGGMPEVTVLVGERLQPQVLDWRVIRQVDEMVGQAFARDQVGEGAQVRERSRGIMAPNRCGRGCGPVEVGRAHTIGQRGAAMAERVLDNRVHRLKIVLEGTRPQVWRRVEVPSVTRLSDLHRLIQVAMGWEDTHLHAFEFAGRRYSPDEGLGLGPADRNEHTARVADVLRRRGAKGVYTYDFGDDWSHGITVEEIVDADPGAVYPRLVDGHGGCPPEDCGGAPGFEYLRHLRDHPETIAGGFHGDIEEQRAWVKELAPDDLDLGRARQELREAFEALALVEAPPRSAEDTVPARPVSLPPDEELARAAVESSPLRELLALARWFGPGRALTSTGMPRPADVRVAATELDLWPNASAQEAEERAERLKRLRAARDLPGFLPLWRWTMDLGLVSVESKQAVAAPVTEGPSPERVLELWWELFDGAVEGDPGPDTLFGIDPYEAELFPPVLRRLYEVPDGAETSLHDLLAELLGDLTGVGGVPAEEAEAVHAPMLGALYRGMRGLAASGGVRVSDRTPDEVADAYLSPFLPPAFLTGPGPRLPEETEVDCSVALTPLGRYGVRRILLREGVPALLSGGFADAGAAAFLDALMGVPPELHAAEVAPWLAGRTPEDAVREVVEAASAPTGKGPFRRALAMRVLEAVGEPALPHLRALLTSDRPTVAGLAAGALLAAADLPEEEHSRLCAEFGPWLAIDMVAAPLEMGEDHLSVLLALNTTEDTGPIGRLLLEGADRLWRVDHPATVPALEAVGRLHPDRKVAKASRRAAHKARSRA
ncbi:pRiA4b ORF-3-like protein [Nocardiopsis sp. Huas11]|nr:pRiA4b ORF-3-like protein [Nocardiopsis sp. Huas11]